MGAHRKRTDRAKERLKMSNGNMAVLTAHNTDPNVWYVVSTADRDPDTDGALFWSNTDGWVDFSSADAFTDVERALLNLPISGMWISIPVPAPAAPSLPVTDIVMAVTKCRVLSECLKGSSKDKAAKLKSLQLLTTMLITTMLGNGLEVDRDQLMKDCGFN